MAGLWEYHREQIYEDNEGIARLNDLGARGWELVGMTWSPPASGWAKPQPQCWFKRQRASEAWIEKGGA